MLDLCTQYRAKTLECTSPKFDSVMAGASQDSEHFAGHPTESF